ncbi:MAG TPA: hypothetical protein ENK57_12640 [Polyangiaceae bacterium]|nr:hypothetical protein [Polyangiaceae bacterium]
MTRSPSGRYLFYGAMVHDDHGYAHQVGIFDLETGSPRIARLPGTARHLGVHPTKGLTGLSRYPVADDE